MMEDIFVLIFSKEGAMILAILFSPVIAILITRYLQDNERKRNDKISIFRILLANRHLVSAYDNVLALNTIDVVFYEDDEVRSKWRDYHNIVCAENYDYRLANKKYYEIIQSVAKVLKYNQKISEDEIKRYYAPRGVVEPIERNAKIQDELLKALLKYNGELKRKNKFKISKKK